MIKNAALRRIIITSLSLLIVMILYLFPTKDKLNIIQDVKYIDEKYEDSIYLVDNNNYVARVNMLINEPNTIAKCKYIIEALTINGKKSEYLPNGFSAIIPENTTVLDISLKDGLLKINFSENINNIDPKLEIKMFESIIYSLTNIDEVNNILIFVNGNHYNKLKSTNTYILEPLNRSFGINKIFDLDTYKEITQTTIYYISKYEDHYYYVPVTLVNNDKKDKIEIIIEQLKSSSTIDSNLMSYLASNVTLNNYEILESKINLSFNKYLLDDFESKSILEEVKYTIMMSLKDNYDIDSASLIIDDIILNYNLNDF